MGAVSILEDIEKTIENLRNVISYNPAPTESAISSQRKRLEKERERIQQVAIKLLAVSEAIKGALTHDKVKRLRELLEAQDTLFKLNRLKKELTQTRAELDANKEKLKKLSTLEVELNLLKKKLNQKLTEGPTSQPPTNSGLANQSISQKVLDEFLRTHPETMRLKSEIKRLKKSKSDSDEALRGANEKISRLKGILSSRKNP